ncbi:MAG: hypothetical protein NTZ05_10890 [Chloroflexi bacterium]|nr:hypothetical protein [Chloroflexota bacterium]
MSVFQGLSAGKGRRPPKLAPAPNGPAASAHTTLRGRRALAKVAPPASSMALRRNSLRLSSMNGRFMAHPSMR